MAKSAQNNRFTLLDDRVPNRLVWRSWGADKTGKNHFGFTAPAPIYGQYLDPGGTEGVADKFIRGECGYAPKEIRGIPYRFKKGGMDREEVIALRDQFIEDYEFALNHQARTIQWDETEVWELFRWAEFDDESDAPRNYGALNAKYRYLIQSAYDAGVNLHLVQKVKEKWGQNAKGSPVPLGIYEPMGFKEANYIVQANLEHLWDKTRGFGVRVVNCRQNMTIAGEEFWQFDEDGEPSFALDFPTFAQLVFPSTTEEDWA